MDLWNVLEMVTQFFSLKQSGKVQSTYLTKFKRMDSEDKILNRDEKDTLAEELVSKRLSILEED